MQPLPDDSFYAHLRDERPAAANPDAALVLAAVLDMIEDLRTRHEPVRVSAQTRVVIRTGTVTTWTVRASGRGGRRPYGGRP